MSPRHPIFMLVTERDMKDAEEFIQRWFGLVDDVLVGSLAQAIADGRREDDDKPIS